MDAVRAGAMPLGCDRTEGREQCRKPRIAVQRVSSGGAYHSHYNVDAPEVPTDTDSNHIYDEVATARVDLTPWWSFKVEGHFIDGYGDLYSAHGFYAAVNPQGLKPTTNMLVLRTGINF